MKKTAVLAVLFAGLVTIAQAATSVQPFDTGQIIPGSSTYSTFAVNKFDTSLGTLTRVTFSISLDSWGGSYSVENTTSPSVPVSGTLWQGNTAYITGALVPEGLDGTTLFAGTSRTYTLPANGDTAGITGPSYDDRYQTAPASANASSLASYEGTGTYNVRFYSTQGYRHTADGGVRGTFESASSQGFLTVTYEYCPVRL